MNTKVVVLVDLFIASIFLNLEMELKICFKIMIACSIKYSGATPTKECRTGSIKNTVAVVGLAQYKSMSVTFVKDQLKIIENNGPGTATYLAQPLTWHSHSPGTATHLAQPLTWHSHSPGTATHLAQPLTWHSHSPGIATHLAQPLTWHNHSPGTATHLAQPLT